MTLFGNPLHPRRNLWGGLIMTALGALSVGMGEAQVIGPEPWPGAHRSGWIHILLSALFAVGGIMQFRLGLRGAHFPADPESQPQQTRTTEK